MAAAAIGAVIVVPASAQPIMTTSYSYYGVSGDSLAELHRNMVSRGPMLNGSRSYGVTTVAPGKNMSIASCEANGRYQISLSVNIKLPKIADAGGLTPGELAQFRRFSQFVKKHEETHRSIWRDCAGEMERRFVAGTTQDCSTAHSRAMQLFKDMVAQCKPRQIAFDQAQRGVLKSHPFMKFASR
jgi:predicted secreted Zn-dependent protease